MWSSLLAMALAHYVAVGESSGIHALPEDAAAIDDECLSTPGGGGGCALNALQLRSTKHDGLLHEEHRDGRYGRRRRRHTVEINCPANPQNCNEGSKQWDDDRCYLYRRCLEFWDDRDSVHSERIYGKAKTSYGHEFCVMDTAEGTPYLIVPKTAISGTEDILPGDGHKWDWTFWQAYDLCWTSACAQLVNPLGDRGQDQLHIHGRKISARGKELSAALGESLCGGKAGEWISFEPPRDLYWYSCQRAKAAYWPGYYPNVFTEVLSDYGKALTCVGISVYTITCSGYEKWAVLWTQGCSLEYQIF